MRILFVIFTLLCSACASNVARESYEPTQEQLASEGMYQNREDYPALIELYKQQLTVSEQVDIRIKLVNAYVELDDLDSANFHMTLLPENTDNSHKNIVEDLFHTKAWVYYHDEDYELAKKYLYKEISAYPNNAKSHNLLGIIYASEGDFVRARIQMNHARTLQYSDDIVINNLAVLDIMEHRFSDAVRKLNPLYRNGLADERMKMNLLVSLAMLEDDREFSALSNELFSHIDKDTVRSQIGTLFVSNTIR